MKPIPQTAYTNVSGFEAKKHNMRQTNDGMWQLTLTVAEFGTADWLIHAQPGTPLAVGLKALDYDNPEFEAAENPNKKYVSRAALFCKDESFQKFIGESDEEGAATALKSRLGVSSRAVLAEDTFGGVQAREQFDSTVIAFKEWKKKYE